MKYVVLGASAAGINGAKELRRLNPDAEILLIAKDEYPYSRCILHHYLSDIRTKEELSFVEADFETRYNIQYLKGRSCTAVNEIAKELVLDDSSAIAYDKLLIATGASTFYPPIEGLADTGNIIGFRNLDDVDILKEKSLSAKNIVVIGGGLVGIDALTGLLHKGQKPTLLEMADHLLSKQLDKRAAMHYQDRFQALGAAFYFSVGVQKIIKNHNGNIESILLDNGQSLPCDLLIIAAGIRPNIDFLQNTGITLSKSGLVIDSSGKTSDEHIFGAGDVTGLAPIWPAAAKAGIVAARSMSGMLSVLKDFFASKSTMNFEGIPTMSLGTIEAPDDSYITTISDEEDSYKKIIYKDGKITGAIFQGNLSYCGILTQLIAHKIDISKVKKPLFEIDYSDFFQIDKNFEFYYEGDADGC